MLEEFRQGINKVDSIHSANPRLLNYKNPDLESLGTKMKKANTGRPEMDLLSDVSAIEDLRSDDLKNTNRANENANYDFNKFLFQNEDKSFESQQGEDKYSHLGYT